MHSKPQNNRGSLPCQVLPLFVTHVLILGLGRDTVSAIYFTLDHSKVAIETTTFPHINRTLYYIIVCNLSIFIEKIKSLHWRFWWQYADYVHRIKCKSTHVHLYIIWDKNLNIQKKFVNTMLFLFMIDALCSKSDFCTFCRPLRWTIMN